MIKVYEKDNKRLYEVYVAERYPDKRLIARRRRGIKTEREAKQVEFEFKRELKILVSKLDVPTWSQWHEKFLVSFRRNYRASTVMNYDGYIKKHVPKAWLNKPINEINQEDIFDLIDGTKEKLGLISQKNILKMLRRIFEAAVDEGVIPRNPTRGIKLKSVRTIKKVLNTREVDILLENAKAVNHRFYRVWAFAILTGMRSGEMFALKWKHVDFDTELISLSEQWTSKDGFHELKTANWRVVPISQSLRSLLMELKNSQSRTEDFVLPRLREWERGEQARVLRDFCKLVGITSVKFHDLRATFITNMLSQGVAVAKVMAIVGHESMETTDEYLRLAGVEIKGATEALTFNIPLDSELKNVVAFEPKKR